MNEIKLPFYAKVPLILLGIVLAGLLVYLGQHIIMPLAFALLISILLLPICNFLEKRKFPRWLAIIICVLILIAGFSLIIYFISSQLMSLAETSPALKIRLANHLHDVQDWLQQTFGMSSAKQGEWFNQKLENLYSESGSYIASTLDIVTSIFLFLGLIPVYVILFLYYRDHLGIFIIHAFGRGGNKKIRDILHETREVIQSYISGLLIEGLIVAILNCSALLMVGLPYAILIGIIAAILNVIPYIGGLVAVLLAAAMAIISHDSLLYPVLVVGVLLFIQFIDNHVLIPNIVASKVSINALVSIVVVLIGSALCGVWGMFLSIPVTAILKIIFDRVDGLKPWGALLGSGDLPERITKSALKIKLK